MHRSQKVAAKRLKRKRKVDALRLAHLQRVTSVSRKLRILEAYAEKEQGSEGHGRIQEGNTSFRVQKGTKGEKPEAGSSDSAESGSQAEEGLVDNQSSYGREKVDS